MTDMSVDHDSDRSCTDCPLVAATERRRFLGDAARAVAAAIITMGVAPRVAFALAEHTGSVRGVSRGATAAYPVPPQDGASIDKDNQVILVRFQGAVYAFALSCPHQNTALRWDEGEHQFQCPKHHSKYQPDGTFISGRATRGMDRFAIRQDGQRIVVDLDTLFQQDTDAAAWSSAVIHVA